MHFPTLSPRRLSGVAAAACAAALIPVAALAATVAPPAPATSALAAGVGQAAASGTTGHWTIRHVPPGYKTTTLYGVSCVPATSPSGVSTGYCWAVGAGGTILVTHDGGRTWSAQYSGTLETLRAVAFVSPTQGWAVGSGGTILMTVNGGRSWSGIGTTTPTGTFNAVACQPNGGRCWAVGAAAYARGLPPTSPWTTLTIPGTGGTCAGMTYACLNGVALANTDEHFAVGGGGSIFTQFDYVSQSWLPQLSRGAGYFAAVSCTPTPIHQGHCIAVGTDPAFTGGMIYSTFTSGSPWSPPLTVPVPLPRLNGVSTLLGAPATGSAWAVGDGGAILQTPDGGVTWFPESSPTNHTLNAVSCPNTANPTLVCVAVGVDGTILTRS